MKLVIDPDDANDTVLGYVDNGEIFAFDKNHRPVSIGPVANTNEAARIIKEWQRKQRSPMT